MARSHSTIVCALALVVVGVTALMPWLYRECRTTYLVHRLTWKIERHQLSRYPENDIIEMVQAVEAHGAERRGLAALIPLANSSNPRVIDWAVFAISIFQKKTPEARDTLVRLCNDESQPGGLREFAADALYESDPTFAREHGVLPPSESLRSNPPVADAPGSP